MPVENITMPRRRFGRTEIDMPVFSCGGMRYQNSWKDDQLNEIPSESQTNVRECIERALELGINHIETARGYGSSEIQLGQVMPSIDREKFIFQTKVGPSENVEDFKANFEKSMSYLNLEYVDLLGLHGINNQEKFDWTFRKGGCLEVVRQWQREGRVKHVGFSTHGWTKIIEKTIDTGEMDYVNLHWYYVNDLNWSAVEKAKQQDMGVFIISPNDKGGKLYEPSKKMVELCGDYSPMVFNSLYCFSRPEVHTLSLGISKLSDFDEHIQGLAHYENREAISKDISTKIDNEMNAVLGDGWVDNWYKGIPEFYDVPGEINILEIVRLWSYAKALDMVPFGQMRYNLLGNGGDWFPGLQAAEFNEKDILECVKESPYASEIPAMLREAHKMLYEAPVKRLSESDE